MCGNAENRWDALNHTRFLFFGDTKPTLATRMASLPDDVWTLVGEALSTRVVEYVRCLSPRQAFFLSIHDDVMTQLAALCAVSAADKGLRERLADRLAFAKVATTHLLLLKLKPFYRHRVPATLHVEAVLAERAAAPYDVVYPHVTTAKGFPSALIPPVTHSIVFLSRFPLLRVGHTFASMECVENKASRCVATAEMPDTRFRMNARVIFRTMTMAKVPLEFHCATGTVFGMHRLLNTGARLERNTQLTFEEACVPARSLTAVETSSRPQSPPAAPLR